MVGSSDLGKVGVWMQEQKNTMQNMIWKPEGDDDHSMRETNSMYKILITFKSQNIFAIGKPCLGHEQADNVKCDKGVDNETVEMVDHAKVE